MGAARRRSRPGALADLRWAFRADHVEILAALARGRHRRGLREYFGDSLHRELSALAADALSASPRARPAAARVLIVPGMMGSRLGESRHRPVWIDPDRMARGELARLALPGDGRVAPNGILLHAYARLLLTLRIEGFLAELFPYDWRLGIDVLGRALAARLARPEAPTLLIAHSMGGLVTRAALPHLARDRLERLIFLGTPNRGSFDPALALRGSHPFVRSIARLDRHHSAEWLAQQVFRSFPGLHDLLPDGGRARGGDRAGGLLDARAWPPSGPLPDPALLGAARRTRRSLAAADARMVQIVGTGRLTIERARRSPQGFRYESSLHGDGTVPVARTHLKGLRALYVAETHGNLANNPRVIGAILDLLRRGSTRRLSRTPPARRGARVRTDDVRLRAGDPGKIDWRRLDRGERAALLTLLDGVPRARRPPSSGL